jgi:hypothetical protein
VILIFLLLETKTKTQVIKKPNHVNDFVTV